MVKGKLYRITWTETGHTQYKEFYWSDAGSIQAVAKEFLEKKGITDSTKLILVDEVDSGQHPPDE